MLLGFILIGWIGGGVASLIYLSLGKATLLGALAICSLAGSMSVLIAAALLRPVKPRALANGRPGDAAAGRLAGRPLQ